MHAPKRIPDDVPATFARQLHETRTSRGWSQDDLSSAMHELRVPIDRATVARLEQNVGKRGPTVVQAIAASVALGIAPIYLVLPRAEESVELLPSLEVPTIAAREWFRGNRALRSEDQRAYWAHMSDDEWELYENDAFFAVHKLRNLLMAFHAERPRSPKQRARLLDMIEEHVDDALRKTRRFLREERD